MSELLTSFFVFFWAIFFTLDAPGVAPIFMSLTMNYTEEYRKKMANRAVVTAFFIMLAFAFSGTIVLNTFGISLPAFRIGGGVLLLLLSIDMVLGKATETKAVECNTEGDKEVQHEDISVFPISIPLLSGPAVITMLILFVNQAGKDVIKLGLIVLALFINTFICWLALRFSTQLSKILGKTGINIIGRIFGILLTALACQFIIDGFREAFFTGYESFKF